jgi:hypothetical protein
VDFSALLDEDKNSRSAGNRGTSIPHVPPPSEQHVCTAQHPWKEGMEPAIHPHAVKSGKPRPVWRGGDVQGYECPDCGIYFELQDPSPYDLEQDEEPAPELVA